MRTTWTWVLAVFLSLWLTCPVCGQPPPQPTPARQTLVLPLTDTFQGIRLECLATYGPAAAIASVVFSPDGTMLYAGGYREIVVWDIAGARLRSRIAVAAAGGVVRAMTLVGDGRVLAVATGLPGTPGAVALLEASGGKPLGMLIGPKDAVTSLSASQDDRWLAAASGDGVVYVWKLSEAFGPAKAVGETAAEDSARPGPAAAPLTEAGGGDSAQKPAEVEADAKESEQGDDSKKPADAEGSEESAEKDAAPAPAGVKPAVVLSGHVEAVASVAFSPDGKYLASAGADRMLRLWDTSTWKVHGMLRHGESLLSVAFRPDGGQLLAAFGGPSDQGLRLYAKARPQPANPAPKSKDSADTPPPEKEYSILLRPIDTGAGMPQHVAFAPSGAMAYVPCSDKTVKAVNADRGNIVASLWGHQDWVYCTAVRRDGTMMASGSADGTVRLWRTLDNSLAAVLVQLAPRSDRWLIVTPQGHYAASAPDVVRWREAPAAKPSTVAKPAPAAKPTAGAQAKAGAGMSARLAAVLSQRHSDPAAVARALAENKAPSQKPAIKPKPQPQGKSATGAGNKKAL